MKLESKLRKANVVVKVSAVNAICLDLEAPVHYEVLSGRGGGGLAHQRKRSNEDCGQFGGFVTSGPHRRPFEQQ
jgi:hypothetical protein